MSGHTPGPWFIDVGRPKRPMVVARTSKQFPDGPQFIELADVKSMADARLIAAAPDLLAAVKGLASYAYSITNPSLLPHDYQLAVRAIAKAEGRDQ